MKIDNMMFRLRMQATQQAIENGEEPPEAPPPITFSTVQELIQKGELSASEASLLDSLLEQMGELPTPQIASLRAQLSTLRGQQAEQATPDEKLRDYAPGPPTPAQEDGPVLPLHGSLMQNKISGGGDD